ncbi:MAG: replicative DNA helicase [Bacteroidales bacterium]|nr:replicative DNA helicase [Bacteroidales bacterium]MBO7480209.1 replicative DNA helicase [Bacteroidales bacterium]
MPQRKKEIKVDLSQLSADMGRKPPQAIEIEEAVLAAMMLDNDCINDVLESLTPECFYNESNKKIYKAIQAIASRNDKVDILTVADELTKSGDLEAVGGASYLSSLSMKIGAAANTDYHTKILLQKFIQRELIAISYRVQKQSFEDSMPVDDLLQYAQQEVFVLAERNMKRDTSPIQMVINQAIDDIQKGQERQDGLSGVPSGYANIDKITYGWQPSDLIILAARPSVGKTAFVLTMARNMAVDYNVPVAFFSLEMSQTQLVKRLLVSETGIPSDKIWGAKKFNDPQDWDTLNERIGKLSKAPLWIDDTPSLSIYEFRSKARRLVQTQNVKMIIIDYLQLMTGPVELRGMREQEVSAISRSLKSIAKDLNVPILALSQLNRSVETRGGNKRPQLSDLRESGAIEQDADIVMFIHRPEFFGTAEADAYPGQTQLIIAKHRNGETGDVEMRFISSEVRFEDANVQYKEYESRMNEVGTSFDIDY